MRKSLGFVGLLVFSASIWATNYHRLADLTAMAVRNNKDLQAALYNIKIAQARLLQSGLWNNPQLSLLHQSDKVFADEGEFNRGFTINQLLPISGRIHRQQQVAALDICRAQLEVANFARQLKAQVAQVHNSLLINRARHEQLAYLLQLNQQLIKVIDQRHQLAEISELDMNIARIEVQKINQEQMLLASQKAQLDAQLNQLLGQPHGQCLNLDQRIPLAERIPPLAVLQKLAKVHRPDRQSLLNDFQQAQAEVRLAKANRWADWQLGVGVSEDRLAVEGAPPQPPDKSLNISLNIPIPVLNANQGLIQAAQLAGTQALKKLQALDLQIDTELQAGHAQLLILQKALQQSRSAAHQLGLKNVKLAKEAYNNGQLPFVNVIQIQRQQNELQMTHLDNVERYLQAKVALCAAVGSSQGLGFCQSLQ